jgi:IgA Peptidase M64
MHARARQRRALLHGGAAAGLSLFVPGCGPKPEADESAASGPPRVTTPTRPFADGALRIDFLHAFQSGKESFTPTNLRHEPTWAGPRARLTEDIGWGDYRISVYDAASQKLLFRDCFESSLSPESNAAAARVSVRLPLPYDEFRAVIEKRRAHTVFQSVWERSILPTPRVVDRTALRVNTVVDALLDNGPPESKVDLAILAEGYTDSQYGKFNADAKRAMDYVFSVEPFKARVGDFNVRAVFAESNQSGVTDRHFGIDRDTVLRCAYGQGAAERTLEPTDVRLVSEAAASTPNDFVLVLANSRRYGGSAYFRGPAVAAIDSAFARYLVLHELGHVIAGLAEEYYVALPDPAKYSGNIEPWYPNVTTSNEYPKWQYLMREPATGPTRWNKAEYEAQFADYVKRYEKLRAAGAAEDTIERLMREASARQAALLARNRPLRRIATFEGANGYAEGMYRSEVNCIMFSLQSDYFCAACSAAIDRMINYHTL